MKQWRLLGWGAALIAVVAFAAVLRFVDDPFFMVGGSDSTSFLVGPPVWVQLLSLVLFAAAMLLRRQGRWGAVRVVVALAALAVGGHRLVIDNVRGELRDTYLALPVAHLKLDGAREGGLRLAFSPFGVSIGQVGATPSLWLFSPTWIGLDRMTLRRGGLAT